MATYSTFVKGIGMEYCGNCFLRESVDIESEDKRWIVSYCILNGKKWVMFEDKQCAAGEVKLTDGFMDKLIRWNSDKLIEWKASARKIDLRKS